MAHATSTPERTRVVVEQEAVVNLTLTPQEAADLRGIMGSLYGDSQTVSNIYNALYDVRRALPRSKVVTEAKVPSNGGDRRPFVTTIS